jgi:hypothetical protein
MGDVVPITRDPDAKFRASLRSLRERSDARLERLRALREESEEDARRERLSELTCRNRGAGKTP